MKSSGWFVYLGIAALLVGGGAFWLRKKAPEASGWMVQQIERDLSRFKDQPISRGKIIRTAADPANDGHLLIHYSIRKNKVTASHRIPPDHPLTKDHLIPRMKAILSSLQNTVRKYPLPDLDFVVTIHDALHASFDFPLFVMATVPGLENQILIPDFEALRGTYQVIKPADITDERSIPAWQDRKGLLVWRGGPGQHPPEGFPVSTDPNEAHCLSRIKLCHLSTLHPDVIDSRFSYLGANWEMLAPYLGSFLTYPEQLSYKYHMLIDGYSCSYYSSGWKFFSGSLVFKEDSKHIQWYYSQLKPNVHYIPVKEGLADLLEKIQWAKEHDEEAAQIARQGREFALSHITQDKNRAYLYHLLLAYSRLNWVD